MRRLAWSQLKSATEPGLPLQLRLLIELLQVLPRPQHGVTLVLRPSNVLVAEDGTVNVGAARLEGADLERRYRAPELAEEEAGDVRAAIYAVGAMLFEAVSGYPFESAEMVQQELFGSRAMAKAAGLGAHFWEIYLLEAAARATSADPDTRWATPKELADDLQTVARERIASREALAELVCEALRSSAPPRRRSRQPEPGQRASASGTGTKASDVASGAPATAARASSGGRPRQKVLGDEETTVAVATVGRLASATGGAFDVEPETLPRHTTTTGHFDPEPATLPRYQTNVQRHQTLLGVGVSAVQQAVQAASAARVAAPEAKASPVGRHPTLLGVGLPPGAGAPLAKGPASLPDAQPLMLVRRATPGGTPATEPSSTVEHEPPCGKGAELASPESQPSPGPDSKPFEVSVPPIETSHAEPDFVSEPWKPSTKRRSTGTWLVLALLSLCVAAGALEYQGGHVTHSLESLGPLVTENLPEPMNVASDQHPPTTESTPALAASAVPSVSAELHPGVPPEVQPAPAVAVDTRSDEAESGADEADPEAGEAEAPAGAEACDDCEPESSAGSPDAPVVAPAKAKLPAVPKRRVPKRPGRSKSERDYGI